MDRTRLRCYVSPDGDDLICDWYAGEGDAVQAAFIAILEILRSLPIHQWPESLFKNLDNRPGSKCAGLAEIILDDVDDSTYFYRILGFNGPDMSDFTMLYVFNKKSSARYDGPCEVAQVLKKNVEQSWNQSRACQCAPSE